MVELAALSPHAASGGCSKGEMAQRSKSLATSRSDQRFWAPQVSFPQSSSLNKTVEYNNKFTFQLNNYFFTIHSYFLTKYAGVAELADAPDLGSGGTPVQVQVLSPAPITKESRL